MWLQLAYLPAPYPHFLIVSESSTSSAPVRACHWFVDVRYMSFRDSDVPRFRYRPVLEAYGRGIRQDCPLRAFLRRLPEEEGRDAEVEVDEVFGLYAGSARTAASEWIPLPLTVRDKAAKAKNNHISSCLQRKRT
jgi:hypothetical protein